MSECCGPETAEHKGVRFTSSTWLSSVTNSLWAPVAWLQTEFQRRFVFSLQTNCSRLQLESGQDLLLLLLGDLSSVDVFHIRVQLLRSIMPKQTETKKRPQFLNERNKQTTNYSSRAGWEDCDLKIGEKIPWCPVEVIAFSNYYGIEEFTSTQQTSSFWKLSQEVFFYLFISAIFPHCDMMTYSGSLETKEHYFL